MKKISLFSALLASLAVFFVSCDLFMKPADPDYFDKINEEIAWANAPKVNVTVVVPSGWGISPQYGTGNCGDVRVGYPFDVEFAPDSAYSFVEWRAYATSSWQGTPGGFDAEPLDQALVSVPGDIPARGGIGSFVINTTEPVTLVPWCKTQPYVTKTVPANSSETVYPWGTNIVVYFNVPLDLAQDVGLDSPGIMQIKIFNDQDVDVTANYPGAYSLPVYTEDTVSGLYKISMTAMPEAPGNSLVQVTVGPEISNLDPDAEKMEKAEVFFFRTGSATSEPSDIIKWGATYNSVNRTISTSWETSKGGAVRVRYRIDSGSDNELSDGARVISGVSEPSAGNVREGQGVSGIREYEIFLDLYVGGIKSNDGSKSFKIWNIPGMSVSDTFPAIEISTQAEFNAITLNDPDVNYVLVNDITASVAWTPKGISAGNAFQGKFYGNGHTITVNSFSNAGYTGIFGYVNNAEIRDLSLVFNEVSVEYGSPALHAFGGLAAHAGGTTAIRNIITSGNLALLGFSNENNKSLGGISGYVAGSAEIDNCLAGLNLTCTENTGVGVLYAGGVIGLSEATPANTGDKNIANVTFSGVLSVGRTAASASSRIGGIAGGVDGSTLNNCSSTGRIITPGSFKISAGTYFLTIGGVVGFAENMTATNSRASGDLDCTAQIERDNLVLVGGIAGDCDGSIFTNCRYEQGSISTAVTSMREIILDVYGKDPAYPLYAGGAFGRIIGDSDISGCYSKALSVGASLYGPGDEEKTADSVYVGGFAGLLNNGTETIEKCYATAQVNSLGFIAYTGGFAGCLRGGSISECYASGNVKAQTIGSHAYAGGFVGLATATGGSQAVRMIQNCYALGDVEANGPGQVFAGGLLAIMQDGVTSIKYCFACGSVSALSTNQGAQHTIAGGLVAYRDSDCSISNSLALGESVTIASMGTHTSASVDNDLSIFNVRRIVAFKAPVPSSPDGSFSNNHALYTMFIGEVFNWDGGANPSYVKVLPSEGSGHDLRNGEHKTLRDLVQTSTWTEVTATNNPHGPEFSTTIWNFSGISRGYPRLAWEQ